MRTPDASGSGRPLSDPVTIADLLAGAAQSAIRESAGEVSRAQGKRGVVYLNVELMLGDGGEPLWLNSSVYFQQKRHHKDAARERAGG